MYYACREIERGERFPYDTVFDTGCMSMGSVAANSDNRYTERVVKFMPRKYKIGIGDGSIPPLPDSCVTCFLAVSQTVETDLFAFPYVA